MWLSVSAVGSAFSSLALRTVTKREPPAQPDPTGPALLPRHTCFGRSRGPLLRATPESVKCHTSTETRPILCSRRLPSAGPENWRSSLESEPYRNKRQRPSRRLLLARSRRCCTHVSKHRG